MAWTRPIPAVAVAMAASLTAFGLSTWGRSTDSTRSAAWASRSLPASVLGQRPEWKGCGAPFECTSVKVPRDYSAPEKGGTIALALVRVRATRPQGRLGSLVFASGGSGIEGLRRDAADYRNLNTRYDLVSFDPRGTAVDCLDDASMDRFLALDTSPDDPAEERALTDGHTSFRRACQANSGDVLPYVGTPDSARDLDVIRAVLGDRRLHYFGTSHGTWLGGNYAHQLPGNVGRAVLDGAVDTELDPLDLGLQRAAASQRALGDFAAYCTRACPSGVNQTSIATLLDALDHRPLPAAGGRKLTQSLATTAVSAALHNKRLWPTLARALTEATRGNGTTLLTLADTHNDRRTDGRRTDDRHADRLRDEGRRADGRYADGRHEDGRRADGRRDEGRRVDGRYADGRRDDVWREGLRRADGRRVDVQRVDGRRVDGRGEDGRRVDVQREGGRRVDVRRVDVRRVDVRRVDVRRVDGRRVDVRRVDGRYGEGRREEGRYGDGWREGGWYGGMGGARRAITCADTIDRYDVADVRELLPRFRNVSPVFGPSLAWGLLDCAGWPVRGDGAAREVSAPGAAPMVVIGTTGDPATPYAWAPALTKRLGGRAALLTLQGEGHGAYASGDPCVRRAVDAYLLDGVVPSNGATCG